MRLEPAQMILLGDARAEDDEALGSEIGHGEIADEFALVVEHRRQRHAALARQPIREHVLEPPRRSWTRNFVARKGRDFQQADFAAYGAAFLTYGSMSVRASVSDVFARLDALRCKPQRVLKVVA